jgi:S-(hydroxymethyl)glutathione dehydrogenase/alcohol dehydrogenase
VVGIGRRDDAVIFNPMELFHFARVLTSSIFGASDPARDVPMMAELMQAERLDLAPMITHRVPLNELGEAFDRMRTGHGGRTLLRLTATTS